MDATTQAPPSRPAALPRDASIGDAIAHWGAVQPAQAALVDARGSISWQQLAAAVDAMGGALASCGIRPGHRVGLVVPEGRAGGALMLGLCSHCAVVPLNPALSTPELVEAAAQMRLDAVVVPQSFAARAEIGRIDGLPAIEAVPGEGAATLLRPFGAAAGAPLREPQAVFADVAFLLRSSGTTGVPKVVPVTHGNLLSMAAKMGSPQWFGIGPADRALASLPLHYAGGLKTLLVVPILLGASVAFPGARGIQDEGWPALEPTYVNTTPATLRALLERGGEQVRGSSLRFIMCGASYLPDELRQSAQVAFGLPIVEYYGLSEAGVMAANPLTPGEARPGSVGRPLGADLRVVDASGGELPMGEAGEIAVQGASVCPGYLLPDGSLPAVARGAWMRTGDVGRMDADGFLWILAREKEVIDRGGEKVFPYEVEKALLAHPDVQEAAVYGVPHRRLGQGVAAAVVMKPGRRASPRELRAWLAGRLAPFKVPRGMRIVDALPRGNGAKVLRSQLAAQHGREQAAREPADSLLQEQLLALWRRLLGADDIGVADDFFEMGGDSLLAMDLLLEIERLTGASTQGWDLSSLTVNDAARAVLRTLGEAPAAGNLLTKVRGGPGAPLFFCHGDIASRGIYAHRLLELLPTEHPVWLVESPDRHAGMGIEAAASACLDEVLRVVRASPYPRVYLAGWCNAGLVAWHLAHLLRARGVRVLGLFLVETPSLNGDGELRLAARALRRAGAWVPGRAGRFLRDEAMRGMWALRRRGVPEVAAIAARRATSAAAEANASWAPDDLRELAIRYYQRISRYVPPALDVPVTCFIAEEGEWSDTDPRRWTRLAPVVRQVSIPGSHYSSVVGHRATLAARLAECLRSQAGAASVA